MHKLGRDRMTSQLDSSRAVEDTAFLNFFERAYVLCRRYLRKTRAWGIHGPSQMPSTYFILIPPQLHVLSGAVPFRPFKLDDGALLSLKSKTRLLDS